MNACEARGGYKKRGGGVLSVLGPIQKRGAGGGGGGGAVRFRPDSKAGGGGGAACRSMIYIYGTPYVAKLFTRERAM